MLEMQILACAVTSFFLYHGSGWCRILNIVPNLWNNGTYEEYKRLLELYIELDLDLTHQLSNRVMQNNDSSILEAGEEYIEKLRGR